MGAHPLSFEERSDCGHPLDRLDLRSWTTTRARTIRQSSSRRAGDAAAIAPGSARIRARYASKWAIQSSSCGSRQGSSAPRPDELGSPRRYVAPAVLFLELLETGGESRALATDVCDVRAVDASSEIRPGCPDGGPPAAPLGDRGQDRLPTSRVGTCRSSANRSAISRSCDGVGRACAPVGLPTPMTQARLPNVPRMAGEVPGG